MVVILLRLLLQLQLQPSQLLAAQRHPRSYQHQLSRRRTHLHALEAVMVALLLLFILHRSLQLHSHHRDKLLHNNCQLHLHSIIIHHHQHHNDHNHPRCQHQPLRHMPEL